MCHLLSLNRLYGLAFFNQNRCKLINHLNINQDKLNDFKPEEKKNKKNTYESSAKSVIWILALRARISIRWRPSSVWSPLVMRRKGREEGGGGEQGMRERNEEDGVRRVGKVVRKRMETKLDSSLNQLLLRS